MTDEQVATSEIDEIEADPRLRAELAAARLASMVGALMDAVTEATPAMNKDIAAAMGVTAGRISQILSGDGNVRIATLGRLLDAAGYELELTARPKSGDGKVITLPKAPRRSRRQKASSQTVGLRQPEFVEPKPLRREDLGLKFVHGDGKAVLVDHMDSVFPTLDEGGRRTSTRKTWKVGQ